MSRSALITGITGQDGAYLAKLLIEKGYEVFGTYRRLSSPNFWRLQYLDIFPEVTLISADMIDQASIIEAIKIARPDELYHLAAQSFVGTSFEQPVGTGEITGLGVTRVFEAARAADADIKMYQASTSELYGNVSRSSLNEDTPFHPASPYAAAKLYGHWVTRIYREGYGMFACNGIMFNHESPVRGLEFVSRKISNGVAKIALGLEDKLSLGNLEAKRDWGFAPEYVNAMWLILQQKEPGDYVIATNESHSVQEFAEIAFAVVDRSWEDFVKVDERFMRPLDVEILQGDYNKAQTALGWQPKVRLVELVELMVRADLERWQKWQKGEHFPWDAPNYPGEDRIISRMLRLER